MSTQQDRKPPAPKPIFVISVVNYREKDGGAPTAALGVQTDDGKGCDYINPLFRATVRDHKLSLARAQIILTIRALEEGYIEYCLREDAAYEHGACLVHPVPIVVGIDSLHIINDIWPNIGNWYERDWKTSKNRPVANSDLLRFIAELDMAMAKMNILASVTYAPFDKSITHKQLDRMLDAQKVPTNKETWILTNQCGQPMCSNPLLFRDFRLIHAETVVSADKYTTLHAIGVGTALLNVKLRGGNTATLFVRHVLYVPRICLNVIPMNYRHFVTKEGAEQVARTGTATHLSNVTQHFDLVDRRLKDGQGKEIGYTQVDNGMSVLVQDGIPLEIHPPGTPENLKEWYDVDGWLVGGIPRKTGKFDYRVIVDGVPEEYL
ncbi:MAG: hypothetical protein LQ340_004064 [Diploschistes diacapsis]|nr:MAG: hypothetical protein LQ340_004064 [Diploschistes diacapsis]